MNSSNGLTNLGFESIIFSRNTYLLWFFFNWQAEKTNQFWPKKFVFFCNCSNWEKLVKQIGENISWIHNFYYKKKKKLKNFMKMLWLIKKKSSHVIYEWSLSPNEQKALAMLICNLFSNPQTSSYALYFSEWEDSSNLEGKVSNAQIVVDLAKNCVESHSPILNHYGSGK